MEKRIVDVVERASSHSVLDNSPSAMILCSVYVSVEEAHVVDMTWYGIGVPGFHGAALVPA